MGFLMAVLKGMAVVCGSLVAILAFLKVLTHWRATRWVWARNVSGPLSTWMASTIRDGAQQFHEDVAEPLFTKITNDIADIRMELAADSTLRAEVTALTARADEFEAWMLEMTDLTKVPPRSPYR